MMMVFMPLVLVLIGQFCRDVIGRQNVKVVVIGRLPLKKELLVNSFLVRLALVSNCTTLPSSLEQKYTQLPESLYFS